MGRRNWSTVGSDLNVDGRLLRTVRWSGRVEVPGVRISGSWTPGARPSVRACLRRLLPRVRSSPLQMASSPRAPLAGFSASTSRLTVCQRERVKADKLRTTVLPRGREYPANLLRLHDARLWARAERPGGCRWPAFRPPAASNRPATPIRRTSPAPGRHWLRGIWAPAGNSRASSFSARRLSHWSPMQPRPLVLTGTR